MRIAAEIVDLMDAPEPSAARQTQALHGEEVVVYDIANEWAWIQLANDGYVGFLPARALGKVGEQPTHVVQTVRTFVYEAASIKSPVVTALPMGALLPCRARSGDFLQTDQGFVFSKHVIEAERSDPDFVAVAERFLHAPYLWGGKSWLGVDCSGLVQVALARAGYGAPRDTDMLEKEVGVAIEIDGSQKRGDLVFWKGHVAIMQDQCTIVHVNGAHMIVASEPLERAAERIAASGGGGVTSVRRIPIAEAPRAESSNQSP